ncbi:Rab-GAP TBC domain-containing protein [Mucor velutinosus]|uniref:Phosphatidylglycerol/phosphatidylinositol transfer protein n=1 Tax=Mucor velutinosus TaxID=708070 RepID=A0AAN7I440_9FUNG|nr:Rab-GAP TBC domain-containing protein [Mucor velutinosus]
MIYKHILLLAYFAVIVSASKYSYWPDYTFQTSSSLYSHHAVSNVHIVDCSDDSFVLDIKEVKVSPDIVQAGSELTIEASGTVKETVREGAAATVVVKLGVVQLLRKTFDICDELEKHKDDVELQCPIEKGDLTVTQKITLPKEIPRGKFLVSVHAITDQEEPLACLLISVDFRVRRSRWGKFFQFIED